MRFPSNVWALILAGGDGSRLRALTTNPCGTAVPKQFCSLAGGHTLIEDAIARARGVVRPDRSCMIVAQQHREWWTELLSDQAAKNIIVQPRNRGTAIGILYSVLHIAARDPDARIVLLPADHYVCDEMILRQSLRSTLRRLEQSADLPVLLGIDPDHCDTELGYIVPGVRDDNGFCRISRFIEKPGFVHASDLIADGALWNTFIIVASARALVNTFMARYAHIALEMQVILSRILNSDSPAAGWPALDDMYDRLPTLDFSRDVLEAEQERFRVVRVPPCGWSDLGTPLRVAETLRHLPPDKLSGDRRPAPYVNLSAQHALFEGKTATS